MKIQNAKVHGYTNNFETGQCVVTLIDLPTQNFTNGDVTLVETHLSDDLRFRVTMKERPKLGEFCLVQHCDVDPPEFTAWYWCDTEDRKRCTGIWEVEGLFRAEARSTGR